MSIASLFSNEFIRHKEIPTRATTRVRPYHISSGTRTSRRIGGAIPCGRPCANEHGRPCGERRPCGDFYPCRCGKLLDGDFRADLFHLLGDAIGLFA